MIFYSSLGSVFLYFWGLIWFFAEKVTLRHEDCTSFFRAVALECPVRFPEALLSIN